MNRKITSSKAGRIAAFVLAAAVPLVAHADVITLQMPGIPGDTKFAANNALPPDSIRVLTVENSVTTTTSTVGGGGAGKAVFSNLGVVKKFGESSAALFLNAATGRHLTSAVVTFYRIKQGLPIKYYTITLTDVTITSQKWLGNSGATDSLDSENLLLDYARITLFDNETGTRACFDVKQNAANC